MRISISSEQFPMISESSPCRFSHSNPWFPIPGAVHHSTCFGRSFFLLRLCIFHAALFFGRTQDRGQKDIKINFPPKLFSRIGWIFGTGHYQLIRTTCFHIAQTLCKLFIGSGLNETKILSLATKQKRRSYLSSGRICRGASDAGSTRRYRQKTAYDWIYPGSDA